MDWVFISNPFGYSFKKFLMPILIPFFPSLTSNQPLALCFTDSSSSFLVIIASNFIFLFTSSSVLLVKISLKVVALSFDGPIWVTFKISFSCIGNASKLIEDILLSQLESSIGVIILSSLLKWYFKFNPTPLILSFGIVHPLSDCVSSEIINLFCVAILACCPFLISCISGTPV